jgi:acyl-CoA thioester hydrolase
MGHWLATYRGTVNVWECDQWHHMNVRYYGAKFDDAEAHLAAALALAPDGPGLSPRFEQIQYRRELRGGATCHVRSAVLGLDGGGLRVRHEMIDSTAGHVSATLDATYGLVGPDGQDVDWPVGIDGRVADLALGAEEAGAPAAPAQPSAGAPPTLADADRFGLVETYRGVVRPSGTDARGMMTRMSLIERLSDAVGHLRIGGPLDLAAMRERDLGSAAVEYRTRWRAPARAGTLLVLRSGMNGLAEKTVQAFHWVFDAADGRCLATVEIVALYFDMTRRKAVPVPDEVRAAIAANLTPWPA